MREVRDPDGRLICKVDDKSGKVVCVVKKKETISTKLSHGESFYRDHGEWRTVVTYHTDRKEFNTRYYKLV